jgi:hypothetical protein
MIYFMWGFMVLYDWNFVSHKHEAAAMKNAPARWSFRDFIGLLTCF